MPRSRLRRISFLTEMEAPRASKSGMLRNSPRVLGLGCPHFDGMDVLAVIKAPFCAVVAPRTNFNLLRVRRRHCALSLSLPSVDAAPSRADSLQAAPAGRLPSAAPEPAVSRANPWAAWPRWCKTGFPQAPL